MKKENRDSDALLVKQIQAGDTAAFRTMVEKYKDVSLSLACSILKNEVEAEDILQDAFLKVYKNIGKFRFESSFSTWLYRIVVNTCLHAKEKNKYPLYSEGTSGDSEKSDGKAGLESVLENERNRFIAEALKRMKSEEALLLRLYYLCDLGMKEIQQVTGYSEANIKVILHRGRRNIYAILERLTGNDLKNLL